MSGLTTFVTVHTDSGAKTYGPGDKIPKAHRKLITNPDVWDEAPGDESETETADTGEHEGNAETETAGTDEHEGEAETVPDGNDDEQKPDDEASKLPVPKKGSPAKTWAAYALSHGYEVASDAKAAEIREDLAAAGVPVE